LINETAFSKRGQIDMQGNTPVPVVEELAVLVERAERACKTTAQLVRDFNFIVVWYQSRPRSRLRADPILDETGDQEQTRDSPSEPLDVAGMLGPG
jgi:hypothetical protein